MGEVDGSGGGGLLFEWDDQKAEINHAKHGISFDEASSVLMDPLARIKDDLEHSGWEQRYRIVGRSSRGRMLLVIYTEREQNVIRIISARVAKRRELIEYEEAP